MGQVITLETEGKVLEIGTPQKKVGFVSLFLTLIIFLSIIAAISFGTGFVIGRVTLNQPAPATKRTDPTITDQKNGYSLFSDSFAKFQVTFPTSWKAQSLTTDAGGALFQSDQASVEFWLVVDQPVALSSEQQARIDKTNTIKLKMNNQLVGATEYVYKSGTFLTTGSLDATDKTPKVTFLIKTADQKNYDISKALLQTFSFTFTSK